MAEDSMGMICSKGVDPVVSANECLPELSETRALIASPRPGDTQTEAAPSVEPRISNPLLMSRPLSSRYAPVEEWNNEDPEPVADLTPEQDCTYGANLNSAFYTDGAGSDSEANEHTSLWDTAIPACELETRIDQLFALLNDPRFHPETNGFDREFAVIEQRTAHKQYYGDFTTAQHPSNRQKNRYSNVLPPENTRVRLKELEADPSADYINANIIRGLIPDSQTAYIATQGPLNSTLGDFWRMVWEFNVSVIVMLTKEVENGRLKCDRYWPQLAPLAAAQFYISLASDTIVTDELTTRHLIVRNLETGEERTATQYQYMAWPDHGLPTGTTAFLDLSRQVDDSNFSKGPIIVHCSAGIGRSGTFCTVHSVIEKLKRDLAEHPTAEPVFNIVDTVLHLREQRPGMVQTREQYIFCYCCIFEAYKQIMGDTRQHLHASDSSGGSRSTLGPLSVPSPIHTTSYAGIDTLSSSTRQVLLALNGSSRTTLPPLASFDDPTTDLLLRSADNLDDLLSPSPAVTEAMATSQASCLAGQAGQTPVGSTGKYPSEEKQLDKKARLGSRDSLD
eukprot:TRINITY_DN380_c0_g1_i2.p1 TRINITY_DN380_c0_g1~~TRINITY_DN380_c0_g1_i2.p1  ORF type:complete len:564 (+),score=67.38 TRINITY_DN380_c0_g1_i2:130-1821(+)